MIKSALLSMVSAVLILQNGTGQGISLRNIYVSGGIFSDRITVEWQKPVEGDIEYTVLRSTGKIDGFIQIALTKELKYEDKSIDRGVKYWYKIIPSVAAGQQQGIFSSIDNRIYIIDQEYIAVPDELPSTETSKNGSNGDKKTKVINGANSDQSVKPAGNGNGDAEKIKTEPDKNKPDTDKNRITTETVKTPAVTYSGWTSIDDIKGIKLDALMKQKKAKLKTPSDPKEKEKQQKTIEYLNEFYMNPVKMTLFMTISKPYFESGDIFVLNNFDRYEIRKEPGQVIFYNKETTYMAVFDSKKILTIASGLNDPEFEKNIIMNSDLFCVRGGMVFAAGSDGITRLVHRLDVVGLTTGYLKNNSEWRTSTILVPTSRADLRKKMKELSKPPDAE